MTTLPGFPPTYDADGNVTGDGSHSYSWDSEGRPVNVDGVGLTYDALGRMFEQNRSGTYTQVVYSPTGGKLALMSGQTLSKAFVPLPGGGTAVYNSSGLAYYRHRDWLGSSRFASTPTRTMYSDVAYAPFGETYVPAGTADPSFTGQNQDTVGNLYDFMFREYATQGRWPSPDPAGLAAVDPSNPQSWNRYAYVLNDPLALADPLGLYCVPVYEGPPDDRTFVELSCSEGGGGGVGGGGGSEKCNTTLIAAKGRIGPSYGNCGGGGNGDGDGAPAPKPAAQPARASASTCQSEAQTAVNKELSTFSGYAGAKLLGRAAIGAGIGALAGYRFAKYGGPWNMVAGAVAGAVVGSLQNVWQDQNTIQNIETNHYMQNVQACLNRPPTVPQ